jgi:large subunit ribosomal protein L18
MSIKTKIEKRLRVKRRIAGKLRGTTERPRLVVFKSNKQIYAQIIDDTKRVTLCAASSLEKDFAAAGKPKMEMAAEVGKLIAAKAIAAGISSVVFDRNGYIYHGKVKSIAEAAREGGLQF